MSHFAKLDENSIVAQVIVGDPLLSDEEALKSIIELLGGNWLQTSYNGTIRKNYAGIGFTYDKTRDAFIPPKPDNQIGFDEETCRWIVPVRNDFETSPK